MKIIKKIFISICFILVILLLGITISFIINKKNNKPTYILNYSSYFIYGNSMNPTYQEGDFIIIKRNNSYELGDIITFKNYDNQIITHRIIKKNNNSYLTKGDNNMFIDSAYIPASSVYGKVIFKISGIQKILLFIVNYKYYLAGLVIFCFGLLIFISTRGKHVRRSNN